jgi:uncharacterized repeat protein (TIGR03803 family)
MLTTAVSAVAQTETTVFRFATFSTGINPLSGVILDRSGNLYGTTAGEQPGDWGTVYELSPLQGGGWKQTVLHRFNGTDGDGYNPYAPLIIDGKGNLYGTTTLGGASNQGTVFELERLAGGGWQEKILYSFQGGSNDGAAPQAGLTMRNGSVYGTTVGGNFAEGGTVFQLTPSGSGSWTEKVLYQFVSFSSGANPRSGLIFDSAGNMYGTLASEGPVGGAVFELSPSLNGSWSETVLHTFEGGSDGLVPYAPLAADSNGNFYGTTQQGGNSNSSCYGNTCGTIFELSPASNGGWNYSVIYRFSGTDGSNPAGGLVFDKPANMSGATEIGRAGNYVPVFQLIPISGGGWSGTVLYSFTDGRDGAYPAYVTLVSDDVGNLFGTAQSGGLHSYGWGTVFAVTP